MRAKTYYPPLTPRVFDHRALELAISPSTARSYRRDLDYFWAWVQTLNRKKRIRPRYPVRLALLLKFVDAHLSGISDQTVAALAAQGIYIRRRPWTVRTVARTLASLSVEHSIRAVPNPCRDGALRIRINRARRLLRQSPKRNRPITLEVLERLVKACGQDLRGTRDRAILLVGFAGGGRRRSEIVRLNVEDLDPVKGGYLATLGQHKTVEVTGEALKFPILGSAAKALDRWLDRSGIESGPVFRGIHRSGRLLGAMHGQTILRMVRRLAKAAGLPELDYGAHSLRSGFITQAAREGIALPEAMAVSGHRTLAVAWGYYRAGNILENAAAHMGERRPHASRRRRAKRTAIPQSPFKALGEPSHE